METGYWKIPILWLISATICYADPTESATEIQVQEEAQTTCIQERMRQCLTTCRTTKTPDCEQLCDINIKNECLYAGE